MGKLSIKAD